MKTIAITGATGLIGSALVEALLERGDKVRVLTRNVDNAAARFADRVAVIEAGLEAAGDWQNALAGADAVVHLAGEPIADKRWSLQQKQILRDSRVESAHQLADALGRIPADARPKVLVSASGVDYYEFAEAPFDDDDYTERDPVGDHFLARLCRDWEDEAKLAEAHGVRVVSLRCGLVLSRASLSRVIGATRIFTGGRLGSGQQWMAWIHLDDAVRGYLAAIDTPSWSGSFNLVAPGPVRNHEFTREMSRAFGPAPMPVPGWALRAALGGFADYLLQGRKVMPARLVERGFSFRFPTLREALADLAKR